MNRAQNLIQLCEKGQKIELLLVSYEDNTEIAFGKYNVEDSSGNVFLEDVSKKEAIEFMKQEKRDQEEFFGNKVELFFQ